MNSLTKRAVGLIALLAAFGVGVFVGRMSVNVNPGLVAELKVYAHEELFDSPGYEKYANVLDPIFERVANEKFDPTPTAYQLKDAYITAVFARMTDETVNLPNPGPNVYMQQLFAKRLHRSRGSATQQ